MDIFICILLLLVGLVLIVKCGDWFVDSASWVAKVSGIPTFIIGATIVSIGTTLPEVLTSSIASAQGSIDIAVGNAVGSVNVNIALIMGLSLFCMPAVIKRRDYLPKSIILIVAVSTLFLCCIPVDDEGIHQLQIWGAIIILVIFVIYIIENVLSAKKQAQLETLAERDENQPVTKEKYRPKDKKEVWKNIIFFVIGAAGIAGGAMLLSTYGEKLAILCGIPSSIVGVTIIAVGTSLPELTTTIIAIRKKQSELSVGNVVGANIIDITLILPLCSFISGGSLPVNLQTFYLDLPFCLFVSIISLVPALITGKFQRWQGITLILSYIAYVVVLVLLAMRTISFN